MRLTVRALAPATLLLVAACSGSSSGDDDAFEVRTGPGSLDPSLTPLVTGSWLVYGRSEALEAGGTDLNGDGDTTDQVAIAVRMGTNTTVDLAVACTTFFGLNNDVFLLVDEAEDGTDWSLDGNTDDDVLLHWSNADGGPTFVDVVDELDDDAVIPISSRAYYTVPSSGLMGDESNLRYVTQGDPLTPVAVENTSGAGTIEVEIHGTDEGLLFLTADETDDSVDRNADGDSTDTHVLALLDGLDSDARIVEVGLALRDDDTPFAAHFEGGSDWTVGVLVDEAMQGATNFNPPIVNGELVVPDSCQSTPDTDTLDQVLHWLRFEDFSTGADTAHNTGIAGADRVLAVNDHVAVLSPEIDANCNYNEDAASDDTVVRWIEASTGSTPPRDPSQLHAVATGIDGGSFGVTNLSDRLVCVVSELADSDDLDGGKPANNDLVAWLDPAAGPTTTWTFRHESSNPNFGTGLTGEPYAGATWLADASDEARLGVAFEESVPGINLNNFSLGCDVVTKDSDTIDSLPVWMDFEAGPTLDFDGVGFAVEADAAGIVVSRGWSFFRVSELSDNVDWNQDGDMNDLVVLRNPVASCLPRILGTAHPEETDAVFTDDLRGAAFYTSEFAANEDLNGDGDANDTVLRHFVF